MTWPADMLSFWLRVFEGSGCHAEASFHIQAESTLTSGQHVNAQRFPYPHPQSLWYQFASLGIASHIQKLGYLHSHWSIWSLSIWAMIEPSINKQGIWLGATHAGNENQRNTLWDPSTGAVDRSASRQSHAQNSQTQTQILIISSEQSQHFLTQIPIPTIRLQSLHWSNGVFPQFIPEKQNEVKEPEAWEACKEGKGQVTQSQKIGAAGAFSEHVLGTKHFTYIPAILSKTHMGDNIFSLPDEETKNQRDCQITS